MAACVTTSYVPSVSLQMLKDFLLWLKHVGPWGPLIM